jgi:hypothetical protein
MNLPSAEDLDRWAEEEKIREMTVDELIAELQKKKAEYPNRELTVIARDEQIDIRVAMGKLLQTESAPDETMGRGVGSRWDAIEVPGL